MHRFKNKIICLLFAGCLNGLIALHKQVLYYFDDYGYARLSYGYNVGTIGLHYSFVDF